MILKKPQSRVYVVNLFADFILSKIPHSDETIITVTDCKNFIIIKGKTTSNEILDLSLISSEFNEKYELERPISHTIDLIEYGSKITSVRNLSFTLHKSENCSYNQKQIELYLNSENSYDFNYTPIEVSDDLLVITSEFPHGHSLSQGRLIYLYGKHIFYSIPSNYPISTLSFDLSLEKNDDGENIISIYNPFNESEDDVLKSAILDVFDFNMNWISKEMKKADWSVELTNPLEDYSFIKKRNKDFIIF